MLGFIYVVIAYMYAKNLFPVLLIDIHEKIVQFVSFGNREYKKKLIDFYGN